MSKANFAVAPTKTAPVSGIRPVAPKVDCNLKKCEATVNIGIFFDGTNNNKDHDLALSANTNIARLYDIYTDAPSSGYKRTYIPGVGTTFPEIGEYGESKAGAGCAFGCEGRVIFAILSIFNYLNHLCSQKDMFDKDCILALCRNNENVPYDCDSEVLAKVGLNSGLLQPDVGSNSVRDDFLKRCASDLKIKLGTAKPRIVESFVDVFGFSRGAAEARVFCNWLNDLLVGGCFAGVPMTFRFVGIIDTVASAGFWAGTKAALSNSTGGHSAWASIAALRLPVSVQNCVHMIAMHELRRNFPLDQIGSDGRLQAGWIQHVYPGAHSDVGGGYRPGELGIAVGDDSMKLSQIPLNHMFECAIAAGVPMKKSTQKRGRHDPFAIHPSLAKAYDDFISQATLAPRPVCEWLQQYLNWRWQIREYFHTTSQVKLASNADRETLIKFNRLFLKDAEVLARTANMTRSQRTWAGVKNLFSNAKSDLLTTAALEPEAWEVFALAQRATPTPAAFATLFDGYVHDSLAGFNSPNLELTGYWRYRRVFLGNDESVLASAQDVNSTKEFA